MNQRHYLAISVKHSEYKWKFGKPCCLWGSRTADEAKRCFAGYTQFPESAELYTLDEFHEHYPQPYIKTDEPVHMCVDFMKRYRKYDTVLIDYYEYLFYCAVTSLPTRKEDAE